MKKLRAFGYYTFFNLAFLMISEVGVAKYIGATWNELNHHGFFVFLQIAAALLLSGIYPFLVKFPSWISRAITFISGTIVALFLAGILLSAYEYAPTINGGVTMIEIGFVYGSVPIFILIVLNLCFRKFFSPEKPDQVKATS